MNIIKKDGTSEEYNEQKIINACTKAASRAMVKLTDEDYSAICNAVWDKLVENDLEDTDIYDMHNIVESVLDELYPKVAKSYKEYRNYKKDFIHMMDKVYAESQSIRYIGDKSNANTDSTLVATKRSLIYNSLSGELYKKFFLTHDEKQAAKDGFIYIHDRSSRLDTFNCCLFCVGDVMRGGFEMGNVWYNEPNSLDTAFDVMGDIILSTAAQQYGGFTVFEVDKVLEPYAEKSYRKYREEFASVYACFDEDYIMIPPHTTKAIPTGIACAVRDKYYLQVQERGSTGSIGMKYGAGVIDSGYRGEIFIVITNTNDVPIVIASKEKMSEVKRSEEVKQLDGINNVLVDTDILIYPAEKAIAQLVVHLVMDMDEQEIPYETLKEIPSKRGDGALGSSGK